LKRTVSLPPVSMGPGARGAHKETRVLKSSIIKRTIAVSGYTTSVSLEETRRVNDAPGKLLRSWQRIGSAPRNRCHGASRERRGSLSGTVAVTSQLGEQISQKLGRFARVGRPP
jgi:hypothetical protein